MSKVEIIQRRIVDVKDAIAEYEQLTYLEATELRVWLSELERQLNATQTEGVNDNAILR